MFVYELGFFPAGIISARSNKYGTGEYVAMVMPASMGCAVSARRGAVRERERERWLGERAAVLSKSERLFKSVVIVGVFGVHR